MSDKDKDKDNLEREKAEPIDTSLDITSEHFDPLKALYSENLVIPYKNAKVYDNISKYESATTPQIRTTSQDSTSQRTTNPTLTLPDTQTNKVKRNRFAENRGENEPIVRRFLPHQGNNESFLIRWATGIHLVLFCS